MKKPLKWAIALLVLGLIAAGVIREVALLLAFALSEGSEQPAPMGQTVMGGVITSSLLTLVVVPVAYCYMDDLAQWFKRKFRGAKPSASPAPMADLHQDAVSGSV